MQDNVREDFDDEYALEIEGARVMEELGQLDGDKEAQRELVERHWKSMPPNTRRNYKKGIDDFHGWCRDQNTDDNVTVDKVLNFLRTKEGITSSTHSMIIKSLAYAMRQQYILRYDPFDPEIYTPLTKMPQIMVEVELAKKQHEQTRRKMYKDRQEGTSQDGYNATIYREAHHYLMGRNSALDLRDR